MTSNPIYVQQFLKQNPRMENHPAPTKYVEQYQSCKDQPSFSSVLEFEPVSSLSLEFKLSDKNQNKAKSSITAELQSIFNCHACFKLSIETLQDLVDNQNHQLLQKLGGLEGLAKLLHTDLSRGLVSNESGIPGEELCRDHQLHNDLPKNFSLDKSFVARRHAYGTNYISQLKPLPFLDLCLKEARSSMAILQLAIMIMQITLCIMLALLQLYIDNGQQEAELRLRVFETIAFVPSIIISILSLARRTHQSKIKITRHLGYSEPDAARIKVTRRLNETREPAKISIPVVHLQVGDIVHLVTGNVVPADGILITGFDCKADESIMTGNKTVISKQAINDWSIISGSTIVQGNCTYIVTAIGSHSTVGRVLLSLHSRKNQPTPFKTKFKDFKLHMLRHVLTCYYLSSTLLIIKWLIRSLDQTPSIDKGETISSTGKTLFDLLKILTDSAVLAFVVAPEGLRTTVKWASQCSYPKWLKNQNTKLQRQVSQFALETMGGVTAICSSKTGTLTQNKMTVVCGLFFNGGVTFNTQEQLRLRMMDLKVDIKAQKLVTQCLNINTSVATSMNSSGTKTWNMSQTDLALQDMTSVLSAPFETDYNAMVQLGKIPLTSKRRKMSTIISKHQSHCKDISFDIHLPGPPDAPINGEARMYTKGGSEIVLASCEWMVNENWKVVRLTKERRAWIESQINAYESNALRTVGIAYKDVDLPQSEINPNADQSGLIWLGVVGIEDLIQPEVPQAIEQIKRAGIMVCMVTGDSVGTACAIAKQCGIMVDEDSDWVMTGSEFRKVSNSKLAVILPRMRVLARASPLDKQYFANKLKEIDQIVAFAGNCGSDALAMDAADVGLRTTTINDKYPNLSSNFLFLTCNYKDIPSLVISGRSICNAVRKYLQLQILTDSTIFILTILPTMIDTEAKPTLSNRHLLWVNLILDFMASRVLACDPATDELLDCKPEKASDSLISYNMFKTTFLLGVYQFLGGLILYIVTPIILSMYSNREFYENKQLDEVYTLIKQKFSDNPDLVSKLILSDRLHPKVSTMVFNAFVWMTFFNIINSRTLDKKLNVFDRLFYNKYLVFTLIFIILMQTMIIQFGNFFFETVPLSVIQWAISLTLGLLVLPLGAIIKLIPDFMRSFVNHMLEREREQNRNLARLFNIRSIRCWLSAFKFK